MRHFLIALLNHHLLNISLRRDQFFAYRLPSAAVAQFGEARAMANDLICHAEAASLSH